MLSPPRTSKSVVFLIDSYTQKVLLSVTITFLSGVDSSCLRRNCRKFAALKNAKNDRFFTDLNHLILERVHSQSSKLIGYWCMQIWKANALTLSISSLEDTFYSASSVPTCEVINKKSSILFLSLIYLFTIYGSNK